METKQTKTNFTGVGEISKKQDNSYMNQTIDINAKEWFDKVNGNSYFCGTITINYGMKTEQTFLMPFQ